MQNVTITIKLPEVYYQVALQAHLLGETDLSQDKDARAVSLSQLDVEGEGREVILRAVKSSDASLRQHLHLYLTEENAATSVDNVPKDEESLTFSLRLPDNFFLPAIKDMEEAIHHYLVHTCLSEWYALMKDEMASTYSKFAQADLDKMKQASSRRMRPTRPANPYE